MDIELNQTGSIFAYNSPNIVPKRDNDPDNQSNRQNIIASAELNDRKAANKFDFETKESLGSVDKLVNQSATSDAELETAMNEVADFIQSQNRNLDFSFDEKSNRSIIKVTDSESGETIRQIPSEEVLKLAERINELRSDAGEAVGVLINRKV